MTDRARLVLFDFDGTISSRDSMFHFLRFYAGAPLFFIKLLLFAPVFIALGIKLISDKRAKELLFAFFFKGVSVTTFKEKCEAYCSNKLPLIIKKSALEQLHKHLNQNDKVYIVSASLEQWLQPWVNTLPKLGLIGTVLKETGGVYTGEIEGENCKGIEKVNRIKQKESLEYYYEIIAYGDTKGDKEMLELAHRSYYQFFQ